MDPGHLLVDRHGAILEADAAFGRLLRSAPGLLRGRDVLSLTADSDRPQCADAIRHLLATGQSFDMVKRFVRADATVLWVRNSVSLMTLDHVDIVVATCSAAPPAQARGTPATLLASARTQLDMIEDRQRVGDPMLLWGPNWITLLQVFIAEAEGRLANATSLADGYGLSRDVMRRWLTVLIRAGLLEVETGLTDPYTDKSYRLTSLATERLEAHLSRFARETSLPLDARLPS